MMSAGTCFAAAPELGLCGREATAPRRLQEHEPMTPTTSTAQTC
jgi:hypothetical protein